MPKQRTPEEAAEYMRTYRARKAPTPPGGQRESGIAPVPPGAPDLVAKANADLEHRLVRQRADRRQWHNPYEDGLPDWPELISGMSQQRRDTILANPAIRTPSRPW